MLTRGLLLVLPYLSWISLTPAVAAPPPFSSTSVKFHIYPTRETPETEDIDGLIPSHPVTLLSHGFKGDHNAKSMLAIKEALLLAGVQNVVIVDWGVLADSLNKSALAAYHRVRDHGVTTAAALVVQWLQHVMEHKSISPEHVHLIGFSLGAHLSGMVGRLLNSTVGRITGLDPPKFGYERVPLDQRLDEGDARFVNVIHTSAGILSYNEDIGHVDFFPNGDSIPQHGCPHDSPIHLITCSHYFSFILLVESILNPAALMATQCDSWQSFTKGRCDNNTKVAMGYATPNTTRGTFFMRTKDKPPFGEEDPDHPLPERMIQFLTYDKSDSIVNPSDVVNFLMQPLEKAELADNELSDDSKVMRVKNGRHATTTLDPPAFLSGGGRQSQAFNALLMSLTSLNLIRQYFESLDWRL